VLVVRLKYWFGVHEILGSWQSSRTLQLEIGCVNKFADTLIGMEGCNCAMPSLFRANSHMK